MECEKCGGNGRIYLNRNMERGSVYRRRRCTQCGYKWTTIELPAEYIKEIVLRQAEIASDVKKKIAR